jgi:hypothetical protein
MYFLFCRGTRKNPALILEMASKDTLSWKGYSFKRIFKGKDVYVAIEIWFRGKKLKEYEGITNHDRILDREYTFVNLYKMLPGSDFQAVVYCSGGGKDHNGGYSVLDLDDKGNIREIFDSMDYLLEGYYDIAKLPNISALIISDVATPWVESSFSFCSADMPKVHECFAYSASKGKYIPAVDACFEPFDEDAVGNTTYDEEDGWDGLAIVLNYASYYWFAGKEKEGWNFFKKHYSGKDKAEKTREIKKVLAKDPYIKGLNN